MNNQHEVNLQDSVQMGMVDSYFDRVAAVVQDMVTAIRDMSADWEDSIIKDRARERGRNLSNCGFGDFDSLEHREYGKLLCYREAEVPDEGAGLVAFWFALNDCKVEILNEEPMEILGYYHTLNTTGPEPLELVMAIANDPRCGINRISNGQEQDLLECCICVSSHQIWPSCLTPLMLATIAGRLDVMKALLVGGAEVNPQQYCMSALHIAAAKGNIAAIELLMSYNSYLEAYDEREKKSMWYALEEGELAAAKALLAHGALLEWPDGGRTSVPISILQNMLTFKFLIDEGLDFLLPTLLLGPHLRSVNAEHAQILLDAGADVNTSSQRSGTPLQIAIEKGDLYLPGVELLIEVLLQEGADTTVKNRGRQTPADVYSARTVNRLFRPPPTRLESLLGIRKVRSDGMPAAVNPFTIYGGPGPSHFSKIDNIPSLIS